MEGIEVEIIPIRAKDGISMIAFGFKEILDDYSKEIKRSQWTQCVRV
jgi:hypothetical protein